LGWLITYATESALVTVTGPGVSALCPSSQIIMLAVPLTLLIFFVAGVCTLGTHGAKFRLHVSQSGAQPRDAVSNGPSGNLPVSNKQGL